MTFTESSWQIRCRGFCFVTKMTFLGRSTLIPIYLESMKEQLKEPINYGGQAVLEGVMMRGSKALAVAVRNPQGEIIIHTEPLNQTVYNSRLGKTPFLRGLVLLWDALGLGIKSLMFSADVALDEEDEDEDGETASDGLPSQAFSTPVQIGTVLLSLSMSIGLFIVLPAFIAGLVEPRFGVFAGHVVEGITRLLLLIGYVSLIAQMEDVRRLYGYHGAEHKTINAFEGQSELVPSKVAQFPIEHPRCGTAFLLTVVVISILLYSVIPLDWLPFHPIVARVLSRIVLLPIVAGLAYEYIRLTAKYQDRKVVQWLIKPNLALQHLTTREPDESMIEVAIAAFEEVLKAESATTPLTQKTFVMSSDA